MSGETEKRLAAISAALAEGEAMIDLLSRAEERLQSLGVYGAIPEEEWQKRPLGRSEYLYLRWKLDPEKGVYGGPKGAKKLYIGKSGKMIAQARRFVENTRTLANVQTARRFIRIAARRTGTNLSELARNCADITGAVADARHFLQIDQEEKPSLPKPEINAVGGLFAEVGSESRSDTQSQRTGQKSAEAGIAVEARFETGKPAGHAFPRSQAARLGIARRAQADAEERMISKGWRKG